MDRNTEGEVQYVRAEYIERPRHGMGVLHILAKEGNESVGGCL